MIKIGNTNKEGGRKKQLCKFDVEEGEVIVVFNGSSQVWTTQEVLRSDTSTVIRNALKTAIRRGWLPND